MGTAGDHVVVARDPVGDPSWSTPAVAVPWRLAEQPDDERRPVIGRQRETAEGGVGRGQQVRIVRLEQDRLGHQAVAALEGRADDRELLLATDRPCQPRQPIVETPRTRNRSATMKMATGGMSAISAIATE